MDYYSTGIPTWILLLSILIGILLLSILILILYKFGFFKRRRPQEAPNDADSGGGGFAAEKQRFITAAENDLRSVLRPGDEIL